VPVSLRVGENLKLSLSTGSLYAYPLRQVFRWAREAGFDGVELAINPEAIRRSGEGTKDLAEEENTKILSVHPVLGPIPGWRERHGGFEPTLSFAQATRASVLVMHTPKSESLEAGEGLAFRKRVETWQPCVAGTRLRLAVENKAIRSQADSHYALTPLDNLRAFADRYDLGLVLDTSHAGSAGDALLYAQQLFHDRLVNVHLSDMGEWIPYSRARNKLAQHRFPGAGRLPLSSLLARLAQTNYEGLVTLEVSPFAVRAWWPPALRRRLAQAVVWMRYAVGE
jgi:sugar phosphate isomerase/epimerase